MRDLTKSSIAMVMGQSIEGCGVSRTCAEMQTWCNKNNVPFTIYSYDERKYTRRTIHNITFVPFLIEDIDDIVKELNKFDVVLFNSYPSNKFPKESIIRFYHGLVKKVTTKKVGFMHELNKTNIDKIPYLLGIMNEMDLIYNFSEETWFSQTIEKILPSKVIGKRTKKFTMWFNFDELDKIRNVDVDSKNKELLYLGRWTSGKDPSRVLNLAPLLIEKDKDFKCELIGIERSIGAKFDIFDHPNTIDMTMKEPKYGETGCVNVYGVYNRNDGMKKLSDTMFGCSFYRMSVPSDYGNRMEYTQIEIIACGAIPVFDKHWAENNRRKNGKTYFESEYSGIYSDKENLEETVEAIIKVSKDKELQRKIIDTSYKIVKEEFDADNVLPEMFNYMLDIEKDENKFSTDEELIRSLIDDKFEKEFIDLYNFYRYDEIVVLGIRELYNNNIFSILDGKKEKEIKAFKNVRNSKK